MRNDNNLFFLCSLIEFIGREQKLPRSNVVEYLGNETLRRIYNHADVLHCEPIAAVAAQYIELCEIPAGTFDNVSSCRYTVPDYWTIGEVYERLIEDIMENDPIVALQDVYASWIGPVIDNYNSDFYYQSRDYIAACYQAGEVLEA